MADRPCRTAMPVGKALSIMEGEVGKAIGGECLTDLKVMVQE